MNRMASVLVMDTCGATGFVAVMDVGTSEVRGVVARRLAARATQEELLPAVEDVLRDAVLELDALAAVAVVHGPGSFTGVRIGLATAKGLCEAARLPLITMSRLAVLGSAATAFPAWAWLQAGRGEVYAARTDGPDTPSSATGSGTAAGAGQDADSGVVLSLAQARERAEGHTVVVCEELLRGGAANTQFLPEQEMERALLHAAAAAFRDGGRTDVGLADALYLRVPDAELSRLTRQT